MKRYLNKGVIDVKAGRVQINHYIGQNLLL